MANILRKIIENDKGEIKKLEKTAKKVESYADAMAALSDEELQAKTEEFKKRYQNGESLDQLLPEAFAVVREGAKRVLGLFPYRVQIMGGIVLHHGDVPEMRTGEGKTLTATMPVYLNAISGEGVHVITVNEYLSERDATEMGELYSWLGLSVGINLSAKSPAEKREAYNCDITYSTNSEVGFDYLRDNMVVRKENMVQRPLNYALVDEVDSVLIDEARTPLIVSGPVSSETNQLYHRADAFVKTLTEDDYAIDIPTKTIGLNDSGIDKAEEFFNLDNLYDIDNVALTHYIDNALRANYIMLHDIDYVVSPEQEILIVDQFTGRTMEGRRFSDGLHQAIEAKEGVPVQEETKTSASITYQNMFRMYKKLSGMTGTGKTEEDEFREIYNMRIIPIPTNRPIQRIDHDDLLYPTLDAKFRAVVQDVKRRYEKGQPVLVGTVAVETSDLISKMLVEAGIPHEVLNAKNHEKEAHIIMNAGQRGAVTIATNMAGRGTDIKLSKDVKDAGGLAIIGTERHESRRVDRQLRGRAGRQGDPGSSVFFVSLEDDLMRLFASEKIAGLMDKLGFKEGEVLEHNMLSKSVERAQKKVEENNFGIRKRLLEYDDVMNSQRNVIYTRRRHALMGERIGLDVLNTIYDTSTAIADQHAEDFEGFKLELFKTFAMESPFTEDEFKSMKPEQLVEKLFEEALKTYKRRMERMTQVAHPVIKQVYENQGAMYENIMIPITDGKRMYNVSCNLKEAYDTECKAIVKSFQKSIVLHMIDEGWKEHLREMDELRHSVQNASYENKDPLLIYKLESYNLFKTMVDNMNRKTAAILMRGQIPVREEPTEEQRQAMQARQAAVAQQAAQAIAEERARQRIAVQEAAPEKHEDMSRYRTEKTDLSGNNTQAEAPQPKQAPVRAEKRVGRNDPCPCGSGKKYKNCHGQGL